LRNANYHFKEGKKRDINKSLKLNVEYVQEDSTVTKKNASKKEKLSSIGTSYRASQPLAYVLS